MEREERLAIGCAPIDGILGGGIEPGVISEFYGEAGSGKTNVCLQLARNVCLSGKKCIFIDTEGVSMERLGQITGDDFDRVVRNILIFRPSSLEEQEKCVDDTIRLAEQEGQIGLLILDSATVFYRVTFGTESEGAGRRSLLKQMTSLMKMARKRGIPVVITTQVYTSHTRNCFEPIGGHVLYHSAKAIVQLEKIGVGLRRAIIKKHRSRPEGAVGTFSIVETGLVQAEI